MAVYIIMASPAFAHGGEPPGHEVAWTTDPWVVVPLALAMVLYGGGWLRLVRRRMRRRTAQRWQAAAYFAGCASLIAALVSPLHALGEHLFTVHMIEHEIVMAVAAPLLAAARPIGTLLWSCPRPLRRLIATGLLHGQALWRWLTQPLRATIIHGVVIWAWHVPAVFERAVTDVAVHRLQHLSFLLAGLLFWWALIWRSRPGEAAWHMFSTMLHTSALGVLIALSPRVLYATQTATAGAFGLSPLEDQQLAGLIMWVPAGTIYAAACLVFVLRWISAAEAWRYMDANRGL